jgi:hypothetical protein
MLLARSTLNTGPGWSCAKPQRLSEKPPASAGGGVTNKAIAQVQHDRPGTTVRYTLEIQADSFGLTPALGTDVLSNAVADGVQVGIVNPMLMDFASSGEEFGQAVILAAQSTLKQMAVI